MSRACAYFSRRDRVSYNCDTHEAALRFVCVPMQPSGNAGTFGVRLVKILPCFGRKNATEANSYPR